MNLRAGFGLIAAAGLAMSAAPGRGAGPLAYAITATNVTMPASGNGETQFTVSGIPNTGTLLMSCQYSGLQTTAKIPSCKAGPSLEMQVTAGQTATGTINICPYGSLVPASAKRGHAPGGTMLRAGLLLAGPGVTAQVATCIFSRHWCWRWPGLEGLRRAGRRIPTQ